ncbi:hypothetical protein Pint_12905 [Pistacia integerrima]|uniref:Uncharacterized protein n=1 Tax=Pistacia integerrima TaxID=434235 RepID=A0ACC0YBK2_9ROSI|nr:hypothetical protein Pint_12905 [Pistacia integerrima]
MAAAAMAIATLSLVPRRCHVDYHIVVRWPPTTLNDIFDLHPCGDVIENKDLANAFVSFYQNLPSAGPSVVCSENNCDMFPCRISEEHHSCMIQPVTMDEVRKVIFSIGDDKVMDPDGCGRMLKEVNATVIALVPKKDVPLTVFDFHPISCCNVMYKYISKILANRIKDILEDIINKT